MTNRNKRRLKKANHGGRGASSVKRQRRRKAEHKRSKSKK